MQSPTLACPERLNTWKSRISVVLAVFSAFALASTAACDGRRDTPPASNGDPDVRLVVLSPGLASIVAELGREEAIVGRHSFDAWTDLAVPSVGDNLGIDYERLLQLDPDVVVLEQAATEAHARLTEMAAVGGFEVERVPVLALDDTRAAIARLDRLSRGVAADAPLSDAGTALIQRWDDALSPDEQAASGLGRTLVIASTGGGGLGVPGPGSFHHDLVGRIGAEPVPGDGGAWMTLSAEDAVALRPDTIVLLASGRDDTDAAAELPALAGAMAGLFENGRVIVLGGDRTMLPGPGLIGVAEALRERGRELSEAPSGGR